MKTKPVILIVDDQLQSIELFEAYLVPQGYEIVKAANGEEALGKLSGNQIDLILLDIIMPGMDGFEVTRRVRQDNTHRLLPIILITVLRETKDRVKGIEAGCDDFISRPIDKTELLARVRSLLKVKAYNDLLSNYRNELESEVIKRTEELKRALENLQQDITERKRAEENLRASEELFRDYLEYAPDGVYMSDVKGTFLYGNRKCEEIICYRRKELIGKNFLELNLMPEKSLNKAAQLLQANMKGKPTGPDEIELISKEGRLIPVEINTSVIQRSGEGIVLAFVRDITERRRAEETLKTSEERFRTAAENLTDVVYDWDIKEKVDWYGDIDGVMGYPPGGFPRTIKAWAATIHPEDKDHVMAALEDHIKGVAPFVIEYRVGRRDGECRWWSARGTALRDDRGEPYKMIGSITDITDRKLSEEMLRESEEKYRLSFENVADVIFVIDTNLNLLNMSPSVERILGYKPQDFIGRSATALAHIFTPESFEQAITDISLILKGETITGQNYRFIAKDGTIKIGEVSGSPVMRDDKIIGMISVARDITDRKQAEEKLRESEEKFRWVLDNMADVITVMDMNLRFTYVSPSIMRMRGYTAEEATAQTFEQIMTPESLQISAEVFEEEMKLEASGKADPGRIRIVELEQYRKDGSIVCMENSLSFIRDAAQKPVGIISVSRDITERNRVEKALRESEERYRLITENTADTIAVFDLNLNPTYISPSILKLRGYPVQEAMTQTLDQTLTPDSLQQASKMLADQMALDSSGTADPARTALIDLEEYCKDGSTIWVELAASFLRDNNFKPTGILTVTRDITERRRAESELQQTLDSLRKSVSATIQVMVSAVEMRDPYTAGHQIRTADLARAIATEMGLPKDKIDGIRMAGSIHDIGKISIPAEILSKPTKLTNNEFSLIKEHSHSGYEMLKNVESPWPLAQIVYQHHERMDGSGYPRNLKGDEIIMEARILAVSDVVEAMASHRPYRPGLGIDAALAEIEKNKGTHYDNTVADACLRLFREKGYQLK